MAPLRRDPEDDASCIARSLREPSAFRELFARHHDTVHRYVTARLGPVDAPDVVSECFLQAFRGRARFDPAPGRDALPWLLGIATRQIARSRGAEARWHRRRATALDHASVGALSQPGPDALDIARVDAERLRPELLAALAALRRPERDAICACVLGGLGYQDAARALGIPIGTLRSRVSRARMRLRAALENTIDD